MLSDALTWTVRALAIGVGVLVILAALALAGGGRLLASVTNPNTVTVTGEAFTLLRPDKVDVSAAVTTTATTTGEALDKNNSLVAAVLAGLKTDGIPAKDIRTTGFNIAPQHPTADGRANALVTTGYVVTNAIIVTFRADDYSGKIVDRLVRLGATSIDAVTFYAENRADAENAVREQAAKNARARAERIVAALGAKLGRVVRVEQNAESQASGWSLYAPRLPMWRPENYNEAVQLMPQSQSVAATLSVTFDID